MHRIYSYNRNFRKTSVGWQEGTWPIKTCSKYCQRFYRRWECATVT